jgi:hypothetical protein
MTRDTDVSNRDWATMLLSSEEADTPAIRAALLSCALDENHDVRAEALVGIAKRDPELALPLVLKALSGDWVSIPLFEAASLIAHPALMDVLRPWTEPSDDEWFDQHAREAFVACERGSTIL